MVIDADCTKGEVCAVGRHEFVLPVCWANNSSEWPQLAYLFSAPLDSVLTVWSEVVIVVGLRAQQVQKAWSVDLGLPDELLSQLHLAA